MLPALWDREAATEQSVDSAAKIEQSAESAKLAVKLPSGTVEDAITQQPTAVASLASLACT